MEDRVVQGHSAWTCQIWTCLGLQLGDIKTATTILPETKGLHAVADEDDFPYTDPVRDVSCYVGNVAIA